jgi:peptidoglycan/xylan/chitin deacetylase (PgdA/CDA1 family)
MVHIKDLIFISILGIFVGAVGIPRLLKLFDKYNIKTTFFIPGHSLESFPEECAMVRDAGHEMCV